MEMEAVEEICETPARMPRPLSCAERLGRACAVICTALVETAEGLLRCAFRHQKVVAAAAKPRVDYRPNPPGTPLRTLPEALEIARESGVELDDEEFVVTLGRAHQFPEGTSAAYFSFDLPPNFTVPLTWIKTKDDRFGVLLNPSVLDSDDEIVATLAHEVHEARALEEEFRRSGGQLAVERLHFLVNSNTGEFHCKAWDHADELVRRRHGSEDG